MQRFLVGIGLMAVVGAVAVQAVRSQSESAKQAPPPGKSKQDMPAAGSETERAADEAAIRATVAEFERAFNASDAKAVAALFIPDGHIVDEDGNTTIGRDAIARVFAKRFAVTLKKRIEITIESIRFIGADLAVEVGITKETDAPNEPPEYDRYTVLHVRRNGKWQMALARDEEGATPTAHERLRPLAWLVGDWIDDGGSAIVRSTCRWSEDGKFLLQEFRLQIQGRDAMNVSQRIGWDPLTKHIRAWMFDSEGGFGESVWTRDGDGWIIKATGVRPDGSTASATNMLTLTGTDGYIWRTTDRVLGDERQPPMEVKVVRPPPEPKK